MLHIAPWCEEARHVKLQQTLLSACAMAITRCSHKIRLLQSRGCWLECPLRFAGYARQAVILLCAHCCACMVWQEIDKFGECSSDVQVEISCSARLASPSGHHMDSSPYFTAPSLKFAMGSGAAPSGTQSSFLLHVDAIVIVDQAVLSAAV